MSERTVVTVELEEAETGAEYRVTWNDCCVKGEFQARVASKNYVPDPVAGEDYLESVTFSNGVTVSEFGYTLELV